MKNPRWGNAFLGHRIAVAFLGLVLLASCAAPIHGPSATGLNQDPARDGSVTSTLRPPLHQLWRRDFPVGLTSYPLVADGVGYVVQAPMAGSSKSSGVYALSMSTGKTVWGPFWFPGAWPARPVDLAYEAGRLFALNSDGVLTALDGKTGAQLWTMRLPGTFESDGAPAALDGVVYAATGGSGTTLFAADEITGRVLWTYPMSSGVSAPAVSDGLVARAVDCHDAIVSIRGGQLWRKDLPCSGGGGTTPVLHGGRLYLPGESGTSVVDMLTGRDLAVYQGPSGAGGEAPPVFDGEIAIIGHFGSTVDRPYGYYSTLRGIDTNTGVVHWRYTGPTSTSMATAGFPVVTNHVVYWPTDQGHVVMLSTSDGRLLGNIHTPFHVYDVRLAVGNNNLLLQNGTAVVCYASAG